MLKPAHMLWRPMAKLHEPTDALHWGSLEFIQGSMKCFDLKSGKVVMGRVLKFIPMPDRVVNIVNEWGMQ